MDRNIKYDPQIYILQYNDINGINKFIFVQKILDVKKLFIACEKNYQKKVIFYYIGDLL